MFKKITSFYFYFSVFPNSQKIEFEDDRDTVVIAKMISFSDFWQFVINVRNEEFLKMTVIKF